MARALEPGAFGHRLEGQVRVMEHAAGGLQADFLAELTDR